MDIQTIEEQIDLLENSDTTYDNVQELASLYIVYENLKHPVKTMVDGVNDELQDILPYYLKYREVKRRYQLNQTSEGEVIRSIKNVCVEITEFINALYSGTDMNKERLCIKDMISQLNTKYRE